MSPGEVEMNGFIIGVKAGSSKGTTGSLKDIEWFSRSFDFVIAFPMN